VMLQWRYVTGNSCMSPGYCCHDNDDYFDLYQNVSSWKRANTALCTYPLDPTGATGTGKPELFWNCAEITILPSNGQPTTPSPVTSSPTKSPTVPEPCYSINYKDCLPAAASSNDQFCNKVWLPDGAQSNCVALGGDCSWDSCCGPAECFVGSSASICIPSTSSPTKAPTASPTEAPIASLTPTSPSCVTCDDIATPYMIKKGKQCATANLNAKCTDNSNWINNKWCRLSCYEVGLAYEGEVCCNGNL